MALRRSSPQTRVGMIGTSHDVDLNLLNINQRGNGVAHVVLERLRASHLNQTRHPAYRSFCRNALHRCRVIHQLQVQTMRQRLLFQCVARLLQSILLYEDAIHLFLYVQRKQSEPPMFADVKYTNLDDFPSCFQCVLDPIQVAKSLF